MPRTPPPEDASEAARRAIAFIGTIEWHGGFWLIYGLAAALVFGVRSFPPTYPGLATLRHRLGRLSSLAPAGRIIFGYLGDPSAARPPCDHPDYDGIATTCTACCRSIRYLGADLPGGAATYRPAVGGERGSIPIAAESAHQGARHPGTPLFTQQARPLATCLATEFSALSAPPARTSFSGLVRHPLPLRWSSSAW